MGIGRHGRDRGGLLAGCVAVFIGAAAAPPAEAEIVVFTSGRVLSVQAIRIEGGLAVLILEGGGQIGCSPALIARIEPSEIVTRAGGREPSPITPPEPAGDTGRSFSELIAGSAERHGLDVRLLHAVIETESAYRPDARSARGAMGLMQLMPDTARRYAVGDPYDPGSNVDAGARHLSGLLEEFDLELALAAYNAGEGAVRRYGGIPPYPETRTYVRRVLERLERSAPR